MKNKKLLNVLLILLPVAAVVLTAMPNCVMMKFAAPEPEPAYIEYCSGFSLLPVGYGNWSHMLAGILSVLLVILAVVRCFRASQKLDNWMRGVAGSAAVMPLLASLLFKSLMPIGWAIEFLLFAEILLIHYFGR